MLEVVDKENQLIIVKITRILFHHRFNALLIPSSISEIGPHGYHDSL